MASSETPEARELNLVGKVELRIALAESDTKLESTLKTYLPPLLLKLASDYISVRNKVISVCQHINTRVKPPSIKLPIAALLKQYKEIKNTLVRHFDLLYIQQGIDRLPVHERLDLLPTLLDGLLLNSLQQSAAHTASLFNLFLKLLHNLTLPARGSEEDIHLRNKLGLDDRSGDAKFLAAWLGKLFLFNINQSGMKRCPGLSTEDCSFLQLYGKKDTWTPNTNGGMNLIETKVLAARFLASGAFIDRERFLPALFASADPNSRLSDVGDDILKRATSAVSFEDPVLVTHLFEIYLGIRGTDGPLPARVPLQIKILALLCRSKLSSSFVAESTQIVQEGLFPVETTSQSSNSGKPKQGLEVSKLRSQIFAFTNWLARISSPWHISTFAPTLVSQLRTYIESQGWPRSNGDDSRPSAGELSSRSYAYECIGLLAARCPDTLLLDPNLDLLRWLFNSLSADPSGKDISISIEQALSSALGAFGGDIDADLEASLTSLFLHHMGLHAGEAKRSVSDIVKSTRFVAVRFANRCLPYRNTKARWIDILAIGGDANERSEVMEEGRKGLDPYWYKTLNPPKAVLGEYPKTNKYDFPEFQDLIEQFFGSELEWDGASVQKFPHSAYNAAVAFCRCILLNQALTSAQSTPVLDQQWERNIDALVVNDEDARFKVRRYLRNMFMGDAGSRRALEIFLRAAFNGIVEPVDGDTVRFGHNFLEICALSPDSALDGVAAEASSLQSSIFSNQKPLRDTASHTFGILAAHKASPQDKLQSALDNFDRKIKTWRQAIGSEVFQTHGAILARAYALSRSSCRSGINAGSNEPRATFITSIIDILVEGRDKLLLDAALVAIAELSLFAVLSPETIPLPHNTSSLVQTLKEKSKSGDEKAVVALGYFAIQCNEEDNKKSSLAQILETLYGLHEVREPSVQFAIGAALSCAAVGWESKTLIAALDVEGSPPQTPGRENTLSSVLEKVLSDCKATKPALRQASVIWLLCLVQYCGHLGEVKSRLQRCQAAFKGFLADRDSLNQESASRGLTLVYEKGDRALKDDLIRDLVGSFTGTSAGLAGNVSYETELFDPGALPTGDGSVTTYKDIMSLASEVGDPSLVYRFMSLASNNAIWSSRAAFGRFGLSNILSDSGVDGYLAQNPKLYPALFRYRFDPNTNVRSSMNDIWAALVKEPAIIIDLHFDEIMNDLLKNILGKEWRVRQASCAAIADLVQGRPLEKYEKHLSQIWTLTFKVCDDIKDSVRKAAMSLARVLTGILTRGLEAGDSSARSADSMLKNVLPFLLSPSGLESGAQEVQKFALRTLLQIIKSSTAKILGPFLPELVGHLIALLSSVEPEEVNYLHLNADKYGITTQQIDDVRLTAVRASPMMEAIERCLDFLDETTMKELQPSLENAIKAAVGLPSKVGATRILVSLSTRHNYVFKDHADHFLKLARKQLFDRNDTVSSSYAAACGYLARLASDEEILSLVEFSRKLYFESDDERHRAISGDIVYAISKHATDRFNSFAGDILPFVFVAKHDHHERAKTLFQDSWNENVGGSRAVLLYLKEIVALASQYLESPRWSLKHTSAIAIAEVINSSGTEISSSHAQIIWPALDKALNGKTWDGKENVLKAFIKFARSNTMLETDGKVADQMQRIMIRESKRNNPKYRQHALGCLLEFVELRETVDLFPQVYSITEPIIQEALGDASEMDIDSPVGGPSSKSITEETLANALGALLSSINPKFRSGTDLITSLSQALELVNRATSESGSRIVQNAIFDADRSLFEKLQGSNQVPLADSLEDVLLDFTKTLFQSSERVEQTRIKAADAIATMALLARTGERLRSTVMQELSLAIEREPSVAVQHVLIRAKRTVDEM